MSDGDEPEASGPGVSDGSMDINTAVQEVLKIALVHDGLRRGLKEVLKTIEAGEAQLCILAQDNNQPDYKKLIEAICTEKDVDLISVASAKQLGEWAGLCKIDAEGNARRVVACGCCVIRDYGKESTGLEVLQDYLKGSGGED
eukprot:g1495.t1